MNNGIKVIDVQPSDTVDTAGAYDACVEVWGERHDVTLLPHVDGTRGVTTWGHRSHWADGRLVALLDGLDGDGAREVTDGIVAAVNAAISA